MMPQPALKGSDDSGVSKSMIIKLLLIIIIIIIIIKYVMLHSPLSPSPTDSLFCFLQENGGIVVQNGK